MAKKRKKRNTPLDFDEIGKNLARMLDVKQRIIKAGHECGDAQFAQRILEEARHYLRMIRLGLETELREGDLVDITPEQARQAIYGCLIYEYSLTAEAKVSH